MSKISITHPSGIPQTIVEKVMKRRGRLHAFEKLIPSRTALVVVDLDTRTMEEPYNGRIRALAPKAVSYTHLTLPTKRIV